MIWKCLKNKMDEYSGQTIKCADKVLTYAEILETVSDLNLDLKAQKYGILCEHEINSVIALLACFSANTTAVLMSYRYGESHCDKIIQQTELAYIITDKGGRLHIEQICEEKKEKENLNDIAIIMSTSGTTGYPKCAMLSRSAVLFNAEAVLDYFPICMSDTILIVRPIYHCAVLVAELLVSLMRGLNIVLYDHAFNPIEILHLIKQEHITVMCATPTIFTLLAKLSRGKISIQKIVLSGEILTDLSKNILCDAFCDTEIYHVYGLTEAGPRVSYCPPDLFYKTEPNVGVPIRGVQVKIENGELLVKSPSMMCGYYGNTDAYNRAISCGWLHTGDMAEIKNGNIVIKGRKDSMIIRSGMNIYPQEIENELLKSDFVTEAVAYPIDLPGFSVRIGVKVVISREISVEEIRRFCIDKMPGYMLPDEINIVDEIPKNGSGKIIRKKVYE